MTALDGYQWFLPVWFTKRWWDTDYFNDEVNSLYSGFMVENVPCTTAQMARAIQGHIFLQSAYFGPDDLLIAGNITVQRWKEVYTERLKRLAAKLRPKVCQSGIIIEENKWWKIVFSNVYWNAVENNESVFWELIQYKDAILPV